MARFLWSLTAKDQRGCRNRVPHFGERRMDPRNYPGKATNIPDVTEELIQARRLLVVKKRE